MVVVYVLVSGSDEWVRESFQNPRVYMAYRESMGASVIGVKPVRARRAR